MYTNNGVQTYRETDISSMSREKMIVLLYEKIVSDLHEARAAIERGDRVKMTERVNHSQRIISELRNALDHSIGGQISRNLESLYDFLFHEHLELLVDQEPGHIENCLRVIAPLLDAWRSVPVGTGEQAARDQARGTLPPAPGPEPATDPQGNAPRSRLPGGPAGTETPADSAAPGPASEKPELVSVSA